MLTTRPTHRLWDTWRLEKALKSRFYPLSGKFKNYNGIEKLYKSLDSKLDLHLALRNHDGRRGFVLYILLILVAKLGRVTFTDLSRRPRGITAGFDSP